MTYNNFSTLERKIIPLISAGKEDKEIAEILDLSAGYVRNAVQNVMQKLRILYPNYVIANRTHVALLHLGHTDLLEENINTGG